MGLFGSPKPDPKVQVEEWRKALRKELHALDRQIMKIEREEQKVKLSLKQAAKKNQIDVAKVLAKSIVSSRKAKNRIHATKAQLNSVIMQMRHQLAMAKMCGALERSTVVMSAMSSLVKIEEINETMRQLSQEMAKAGLIDEIVEDTMESVFEDEELDSEADAEVSKVLHELTDGIMGDVPTAAPESAVLSKEDEAALEQQADELMARMQALSS
eukprot:m.191801 g.191801  ORF g.191801 m.191801 type:complete len:214 (-) comp16762_c5_seq3:276-917(-)